MIENVRKKAKEERYLESEAKASDGAPNRTKRRELAVASIYIYICAFSRRSFNVSAVLNNSINFCGCCEL